MTRSFDQIKVDDKHSSNSSVFGHDLGTFTPEKYFIDQQDDQYRRHGFKVGNTGLLLPHDVLCEVSDDLPLCALPNSPNWLAGLVNLHGNIVPVIDLALLLNINPAPASKRKQLFFNIDGEWVGIFTNGMPRLLSLPPEYELEKFPAMPFELRPYVNTCYRQDTNWFDVDLVSIFHWVEQQVRSVA